MASPLSGRKSGSKIDSASKVSRGIFGIIEEDGPTNDIDRLWILGALAYSDRAKGRSVAIVAAYLMYARELSPTEALDLVRKARPAAE